MNADDDEHNARDAATTTMTTTNVSFKGRGGQTCKIQATSTLMDGGAAGDVDVLPPENGILQLKISVRVDERRVKREELRNSGVLQAVRRFFRDVSRCHLLIAREVEKADLTRIGQHGDLMRVDAVGDDFQDPRQSSLSWLPPRRWADLRPVPLQLAPVHPTLLQNVVHFRRIEAIKLSLHFHSHASRSSVELRNDLLQFHLPNALEHLVFRSLLRAMVKLAEQFPLLFHAQHAQVRLAHLNGLGEES